MMTAPHDVPGAAPDAATPMFRILHDGSLDLSVSADVIAFGPDPLVLLIGKDHALVSAAPGAGWIAATGRSRS